MNFLEILEHHLLDHPVSVFGLALTRHTTILIGAAVLLMVVLPLMAMRWPTVPTGPRAALESMVIFVRDEIVLPNTGPAGLRYLPYFLSLFFFILTMNLIGLLPGMSAATGNVSVTAALAICTFFVFNYAGIREHGVVGYFKNFVPHGLPAWLIPFMMVLELLGLFTRTFALCIRLFANMIAGHIVILAFLSLIFIFGSLWISAISVPAAVALGVLEVFVAFLQAYIFTLLASVFVGASIEGH